MPAKIAPFVYNIKLVKTRKTCRIAVEASETPTRILLERMNIRELILTLTGTCFRLYHSSNGTIVIEGFLLGGWAKEKKGPTVVKYSMSSCSPLDLRTNWEVCGARVRVGSLWTSSQEDPPPFIHYGVILIHAT